MAKIVPFQLRGADRVGRTGNTNMTFTVGPRYAKPLDNTVVITVAHRTTGGGVSVLLDDLQAAELAAFLESDRQAGWTHRDPQTTAQFLPDHSLLRAAIYWNGSGRTARVTLTHLQVQELANWLRTEALAYRWPGWLRPEEVPATYHDHVRVHGVLQPCRICDR